MSARIRERSNAWNEEAVLFPCEGEHLTGILHRADNPDGRAILLVVGGPQYRAGSHRQFVHFARALAASGACVLRFDYRGMGDSSGPYLDFEGIETDLSAAMDGLHSLVPEISSVCVFGLCDAASAALMFSSYDERVSELILVNPWVRSEATQAKAAIKYYYGKRLLSVVFWRKLFTGEVNVFASISDIIRSLWLSLKSAVKVSERSRGHKVPKDFRVRMRQGAEQFKGRVLLVLSGNDFTAKEFEDWVSQSEIWTRSMKSWTQIRLSDANHTFARLDWKDDLARHCHDWMQQS